MEGGNFPNPGGIQKSNTNKTAANRALSNPRLIQIVSVLMLLSAVALGFQGILSLLFSEQMSLGGIFGLALDIYSIAFSFVTIATEVAMSQRSNTMQSTGLVRLFPFLRQRYGRAMLYTSTGLILSIFNATDVYSLYFLTTSLITLGGMMLGVIAMQPDEPLDYRGFQRPNQNADFLSRIQTNAASSFDQMAAQYISLSSSQYLENQLNTDSQLIQDHVLREERKDQAPMQQQSQMGTIPQSDPTQIDSSSYNQGSSNEMNQYSAPYTGDNQVAWGSEGYTQNISNENDPLTNLQGGESNNDIENKNQQNWPNNQANNQSGGDMEFN